MKELIFSSEDKALQHLANITNKKIIVASEIFGDTVRANDVWSMMMKNNCVLFLYDPKTKKFKKKKKPTTHTQLAAKMTNDKEEQDEILDKGVRGFYFPGLNLLTFYKIGDTKQLRNPDNLALRIAMSKLKTKNDVEVKIIDDTYNFI